MPREYGHDFDGNSAYQNPEVNEGAIRDNFESGQILSGITALISNPEKLTPADLPRVDEAVKYLGQVIILEERKHESVRMSGSIVRFRGQIEQLNAIRKGLEQSASEVPKGFTGALKKLGSALWKNN